MASKVCGNRMHVPSQIKTIIVKITKLGLKYLPGDQYS